jgi:hypothetical protein
MSIFLAAVPVHTAARSSIVAVSFLAADLQDGAERSCRVRADLEEGASDSRKELAVGEKGKRSDLPLAS